ncbi:MAG: FIST C-terminal domain-containing protein [Bacteroidota bacterium]
MYHANTSLKSIIQSVQRLEVGSNEAAMLLFGEDSEIDFTQMVDTLNALDIQFFGGLFPGIIYGEEKYTSGYILKKLPIKQRPISIELGEEKNIDLSGLKDWIDSSQEKLTLLTFVDGLTANIASYLERMYHFFGNRVNFIGGGAGSLSLVQKPCVFNNQGFFQDAAILCPVELNISLGVKHGWQKLVGPIVATKTDRNKIYELNWTKAFDLYKAEVENDGDHRITADNFFDIAKSYPFGIFREHGEDIVRDPIAVGDQGELICVGEVPENTVLYILKGERAALIDSAQRAMLESVSKAKQQIAHTLVVDCISRALFLEEEFPRELEQLSNSSIDQSNEAVPQGVLSLGEISSYGGGVLEFYNKTLVVGSLYQE